MGKILGELLLKLLTANGLENNKSAFWRNIAVIVILVGALGLLQYSEVMLNVRKLKVAHEIERPIELLEFKLETCQSMLANRENDLRFYRIKPNVPVVNLNDKK